MDADCHQLCALAAPTGEQLASRLVQQTDGDYRVEWTPKQAGVMFY